MEDVMHIPDNLRIPVTVFSLEAGFLIALSLIFLILVPS
jgi:hypothetical protein